MKTFIAILIVVIIAIGGYKLWGVGNNIEKAETKNTNTPTSISTSTTASTATGTSSSPKNSGGIAAMYTRQEVAQHDNSKDCWSIVGTSVYNLTSWINQHPGGERAILSICGKDGTTAFERQHQGQSRPENVLAGFFIGTLKLQ